MFLSCQVRHFSLGEIHNFCNRSLIVKENKMEKVSSIVRTPWQVIVVCLMFFELNREILTMLVEIGYFIGLRIEDNFVHKKLYFSFETGNAKYKSKQKKKEKMEILLEFTGKTYR